MPADFCQIPGEYVAVSELFGLAEINGLALPKRPVKAMWNQARSNVSKYICKADPIAQEDREQINYDSDGLKICSTIHLFTSVTKEVIHTHCAVNTNHRHCLLLPMFKLI